MQEGPKLDLVEAKSLIRTKVHCQPQQFTKVNCPCQPEPQVNCLLWEQAPRQLPAEDQPVDLR